METCYDHFSSTGSVGVVNQKPRILIETARFSKDFQSNTLRHYLSDLSDYVTHETSFKISQNLRAPRDFRCVMNSKWVLSSKVKVTLLFQRHISRAFVTCSDGSCDKKKKNLVLVGFMEHQHNRGDIAQKMSLKEQPLRRICVIGNEWWYECKQTKCECETIVRP